MTLIPDHGAVLTWFRLFIPLLNFDLSVVGKHRKVAGYSSNQTENFGLQSEFQFEGLLHFTFNRSTFIQVQRWKAIEGCRWSLSGWNSPCVGETRPEWVKLTLRESGWVRESGGPLLSADWIWGHSQTVMDHPWTQMWKWTLCVLLCGMSVGQGSATLWVFLHF